MHRERNTADQTPNTAPYVTGRPGTGRCETGCTIPDHHLATCGAPDENGDPHYRDDCGGCVPRLATTGLRVCRDCEALADEALRAFPGLWDDLAEAPKTGPSGPSADVEPKLPLNDGSVDARHEIVRTLVKWTRILKDTRRITPPTRDRTTRLTLALVIHHQAQAEAARAYAALPDSAPARTEQLRDEARYHAAQAAAARDDHTSGRDHVEALADHVHRQAPALMATPDVGGRFVRDLWEARDKALAHANPSARAGISVLCDCGMGRVTVTGAGTVSTVCPECGTVRLVDEWAQQHLRNPPGDLRLSELPEWLAALGVTVTVRHLRTWADRELITATSGGGFGRARRYDPLAVFVTATQVLYGATPADPALAPFPTGTYMR